MSYLVDEFEKHEREIRHENIRSTALMAALISTLGLIMDFFVYPQFIRELVLIRMVATLVSLGIYRHASRNNLDEVSPIFPIFLPITIILSISLMVLITEGGNSTYYAGLNLVLVALAILMRWTVKMSLQMSAFLFAAYIAAVVFSTSSASNDVLANNFFFIASNAALVVVGAHLYDRTRRSEFYLQKEIEQRNLELAENQVRLQELDEAKTRFFANVSHELRTPLTIMLGTTETLRDREVTDLESRIEVLHANGLRLLGLIDNLLDLVRFDQGDERVDREGLETDVFLRGIVKGMTHLSDKKDLTLSFEAETPLPILSLDQDKLEKIILNLLINAVKFTSFGGRISVSAAYRDEKLEVYVRDNGIGMDAEKQERIFSRFWQVDGSSNRKFRGSGIGLSLVKSLVDLMDGEIRVESVEREGSTFFVSVPAKETTLSDRGLEGPEDPVARMHKNAMLTLPELGPTSSLAVTGNADDDNKEFRILVADDEEDLRGFLCSDLARNYEVIEAGDGVEATSLVKQYQPDLVLLDYMMPDKNGMEVCREIREDARLSHIPVIMLTARADEKIKLECLQAGASDFISKPFSLGELSLRVKNQVGMIEFQRKLRDKNDDLEAAMRRLKENEVKMLRQEKLAALGRLSAGIIHEINNPLNYVQAAHHMLRRHGQELVGDTAEFFKDALKDAEEGVSRTEKIISDLRSFTVTGPQPLGAVGLREIIETTHRFFGDQLREFEKVEIEVDSKLVVRGDRSQLIQVFTNFFQNSIDAIEERKSVEPGHRGEITVHAASIPGMDGGNQVVLTFADNGCGISIENRGKIFDPFFTSKEVGKGMGMGLSVVYQIIERHRIEVAVDSEEGQFTEFQLSFPSNPSTNP